MKINKKLTKGSRIKNQKNEDQYSNIPFQGDCPKILNDIHKFWGIRERREKKTQKKTASAAILSAKHNTRHLWRKRTSWKSNDMTEEKF